MGLLRGIGLLAGLAGAGAALFAQRRSAATGRDVTEVLGNLPAELRDAGKEWQERLKVAVDAGRRAAARREAEIEAQLAEEEAKLRQGAGLNRPVEEIGAAGAKEPGAGEQWATVQPGRYEGSRELAGK